MSIFAGKVAVVTGGTSGIGRATAIAFAQEGTSVVVAGRRNVEGEETVRLIKEAGSKGIFVETDVTQEADVQAMVEKAVSTFGRLDFAFNNAGTFGEASSITEQTQDEYSRMMDVNVKSVWLSMKYEAAQMLKQGTGVIVNNSSGFGLVGAGGIPLYVASKHAVIGLTKATALEFAKLGIRVNAVCPGVVSETDMHATSVGSSAQMRDYLLSTHPVGRFGKPSEIASATIWLCSDGAGFVTGQALAIDGGYTTQ
ncbi:MAG: SDR family oxidoreductase [Lyngbya sp. HA4199-MV5]|nr:SDR family oxidoreductase [Lyngbya sp. HA4199-MV5]